MLEKYVPEWIVYLWRIVYATGFLALVGHFAGFEIAVYVGLGIVMVVADRRCST